MKISIISLLLVIGILGFTGCEDSVATDTPEILSIEPANGATGVSKTTAVKVTFSDPMDTESCESRFGLHMGELTEMPAMGAMAGMSGSYSWNSEHTEMMFQPDSMLMDSTMYTICLMEGMEMEGNHGTMMMGGMMDHGNQVDEGILSVFTTE
jgi:hypothetical protein